MQLERVGSITMSSVAFQILWKINDINSLKGTFLDANTATLQSEKANSVRNNGYFGPELDVTLSNGRQFSW